MRQSLKGHLVRLSVLFCLLLTCSSAWSQVAPVHISSMKLVDGRSGWLIANDRLFWTDSLGSSWSEITPSSSQVSSVFFTKSGSGWALTTDTAGNLAVARTEDKGAHWSSVAIASPYTDGLVFSGRSSVSFPDAQHGFLMLKTQSSSSFSMGVLFTTADGGAHWTRLPDPPVGGEISFVDAQHGFAGPGPMGNELYSTADGGHTWSATTIGPQSERGEITLPYFSNSVDGYVLKTVEGDNGTSVVRYNTADAGATWSKSDVVAQSALHLPVAVAPNGSVITTLAPRKIGHNSLAPSQTTPVVTQNAVASTFSSATDGWVLFNGGQCSDGNCTQTQSLMGTLDGGKTYFSLGLPGGLQLESSKSFFAAAPREGGLVANYLKADGTVAANPLTSVTKAAVGQMGYDTCAIMSTTQMQDWFTNSPYKVAGIYIGGNNWGCRSGGAPTKSDISAALAQGWGMIPIWVGPQLSSSKTNMLDTDPTIAYNTGVTEADAAVVVAAGYDLGPGSIIYYDMEAYTRNATNIAATQAFLNGWFAELHTKGYLGAVYSSHPELQDWEPSKMTTPPDVIWFAWFFNTGVACGTQCQTVYGVSDIPDNLWTNDHRVRQTSSGFHSTYGSTTYNIDEDWADAPVNYAANYSIAVSKSGNGAGTVTSSDTLVNCGATCSASYASVTSVVLTASAATGSTFTGWTGCDSVSSNTCTISVSGALSVTATFTKPRVTPTIAWTPSATSIVYGTALGTGVLNATASSSGSAVAGTFAYTATATGGAPQTLTATSVLQVGTYGLQATFTPTDTDSYNTVSASVAGFSVTQATSAATVVPSATTAHPGQTITVSTTVSSPNGLNPSGTVTLRDNGTAIGTAQTLSAGTATFTGVSLALGSHPLTVQYSGDANFSASTSAVQAVDVTAAPVPTIAWAPAGITYGTAIGGALNATASSGGKSVAGTFVYTATPTVGAPLTLTPANILPAGSYILKADFTPTDTTNYASASSSVSFSVARASASAVLTLQPNTLFQGQMSTATATISSSVGQTPTGSVTLLDNATQIGSMTTAQGVATFASVAPAVGSHSLTVQYAGDANFLPATSPAVAVTVNPASFASPTNTTSVSISVQQGHTQSASFSFAPLGKFAGTVSLSCTGMPASATCTFSPTTLTGDGTGVTAMSGTVTVSASASARTVPAGEKDVFFAFLFAPLLLTPFARRRLPAAARSLLLAAFFLAGGSIILTGCGGSGSSTPSGPIYNGTAQITAISGSTTVQVPLQLTITR